MASNPILPSSKDEDTPTSIPGQEQKHPEILLWARHLQLEHRKIHSIISVNDAAANTRIDELTDRTKDLAVSSEHQRNDAAALKSRIEGLEMEADMKAQAFNAELMEILQANVAAQGREIRALAASQEREIRMLADVFMSWRNEWRTEASAMKEEIARLKAESGLFGFACRGSISQEPMRATVGSPDGSDATTMDDASPTRQVPGTPSGPVHGVQSTPSAPPSAEHPSLSLTVAAQGTSSLEEYLHYGANTIPDRIRLHESGIVKMFINGLSDKSQRSVLWERLDVAGWTWSNVEDFVGKMIANGKRRLRGGKVRPAL